MRPMTEAYSVFDYLLCTFHANCRCCIKDGEGNGCYGKAGGFAYKFSAIGCA